MTTRKNFSDRVKARQSEALVRQEEYDALTKEQKIQRASARRGNSAKELRRLT